MLRSDKHTRDAGGERNLGDGADGVEGQMINIDGARRITNAQDAHARDSVQSVLIAMDHIG